MRRENDRAPLREHSSSPGSVRYQRSANHPEYPIERLCTHLYEPFQLTFARRAQQLLDERDDVELVASHQGLAIRAETEAAIGATIEVLRGFFGSQIRVGPLAIRYHNGVTLEQPWMGMRILCAPAYVEPLKADLVIREATIVSCQIHPEECTIHGRAPLANLIGYTSALDELTSGSARYVMWLSHYAPVEHSPSGGDAA